MVKKIFVLTFFFTSVIAFAQVAPATRGGGLTLSAGAEYSNFEPDWGTTRLQGVTAFFDLDHLVLNRLGVEGRDTPIHGLGRALRGGRERALRHGRWADGGSGRHVRQRS